jgi:hypothetical protein
MLQCEGVLPGTVEALKKSVLAAYYGSLRLAGGKSVLLDEYMREMIVSEEQHIDEVA